MVTPLRLDPTDARRRFDQARQIVAQHTTLLTLLNTLDSLEQSLGEAIEGRARLLETARYLDQQLIDQELKETLRRVGPDGPGVAAIRQRRQRAIEVQDDIDAVDQHVRDTVLDVEALAAQVQTSELRLRSDSAAQVGARLQGELEQLKADAAAMEAARREVEGL